MRLMLGLCDSDSRSWGSPRRSGRASLEWRSLAGSRQWAGLPGTVLPKAPGRKPAGGLLMAGPERNAEDQTGGQEGDLLDRGVSDCTHSSSHGS